MRNKKFTLSHLEVLEFALEGAVMRRGANTGNPGWTVEDYAYINRAIAELERRVKIMKSQEAQRGST